MKTKYKKYTAFTLIESLVAVSLFVLVVSSALALFLTYSKAQKEVGMRQKIVNQLNFELERIAADIRLKKIQFSGSALYKGGNLYENGGAGITGKEIDIGLTDSYGSSYRYFYIPQGGPAPAFSNCYGILSSTNAAYLYAYKGSAAQCEPLFMISEIKLIDVGFYIYPSYNAYPAANSDCPSNSFDGYYCDCANDSQCWGAVAGSCKEGFCYVSQPSVTISVTAQIGNDANNVVTLQTTVSSRVYQ